MGKMKPIIQLIIFTWLFSAGPEVRSQEIERKRIFSLHSLTTYSYNPSNAGDWKSLEIKKGNTFLIEVSDNNAGDPGNGSVCETKILSLLDPGIFSAAKSEIITIDSLPAEFGILCFSPDYGFSKGWIADLKIYPGEGEYKRCSFRAEFSGRMTQKKYSFDVDERFHFH
jgi:hypothetical protein